MKLYLVRHGESEANITDKYHFPETPLSDDGMEQVNILAKRLINLPIDLIYSSDLKRAVQTAEIISNKIDIKYKLNPNLREFRKPSELWGKSDEDEVCKNYTKLQRKNFSNPRWKLNDDESFYDLKKRANFVLTYIIKRHLNKNVLIVSHGAMIKILTSLTIFGEDLPPTIFWYFWHNTWIKNTGITVLEYKQSKWTLINWNDISHFG